MSQLFEYQRKTLITILRELHTESFIVLCGEKGSGKTFLSENDCFDEKYHVIRFRAEFKNKFDDYNCIPLDIMNKFYSFSKKKQNSISLAKDVAATIANVAFISVENILETLLSSEEKDELDALLHFFIKKENSDNQLFIFDNLDNYDNKGLLFFHKILGAISKEQFNDTKVLVLLDTSINEKNKLIDEIYFKYGKIMYIDSPFDNDLAYFVDKSLYSIARHIPIKYLIELGNNCNNIEKYYNEKLDSLTMKDEYIRMIILSLALFDKALPFNNLVMLLSELSSYELLRGLEILEKNGMIENIPYNHTIYYEVPSIVRNNIKEKIPEYIVLHRFEIFARKLEKEVPFSYILKYKLYHKIKNYDNAYANAVLAYCAIARGEMSSTNEEILELSEFLSQSPYISFFNTLSSAYKEYNLNKYNKCYKIIDTFFREKNIWNNKDFTISIYLPEFIFELIYIREMCVGRIYNDYSDLIKNELVLLEKSLQYVKTLNNDELFLRLAEKELLLQSYISIQTRLQQKRIFAHYFKVCDIYKEHIRKSNTASLKYWEMRYASLLCKINIVSNVPDKLYVLKSGFLILERNKEFFYKKYLRAACNYAGDLMWRNNYKESEKVLKDAVDYITSKKIEKYWGIIIQMYIFSKLYSQDGNPQQLLREYEETVWENYNIRDKMHEPFICKSNYAILLTAAGEMEKAYKILKEAWKECQNAQKGYYNKYLLQTNLAGIEYLRGNSKEALKLESDCRKDITAKLIPTFSYPFLLKRNDVLCNIYKNNQPVDNTLIPLKENQTLSTGYCSDNYLRILLFSDINYWTD